MTLNLLPADIIVTSNFMREYFEGSFHLSGYYTDVSISSHYSRLTMSAQTLQLSVNGFNLLITIVPIASD